jgi:iron complex outermembrane receptor protein
VNFRTALKGASAPIALSVILAANPVLAQDAEQVLTTNAQEDDEGQRVLSADGTVSDEGTIFVTGSRIRRDEFSSPSPLTVIDPQVATRQGLNSTADMVQGSPIAAGSSQITDAISSNFLTNGGAGAQTISLRGLGAERTLVLLNGRRAGPAGTRGAVSAFDLNVLPQSIVGQVDLLKDGASSIYGSDAVAGVVNLITKRDTDGIEFDFFGSVPMNEGGEQWSAAATWGQTFDRGHFLVSASYQRRNELARGDRDYLGCTQLYGFTDENFDTRADLIDPRTGDHACVGESNSTWGHIWTYDYSYYYGVDSNMPPASPGNPTGDGDVYLLQYDYDGSLARNLSAVPARTQAGNLYVPDGWYIVGIDPLSESLQNNFHPDRYNDSMIPETDLYTIYAEGSYELTDFAEFYVEGLFNKRQTYVNSSAQIYMFGLGESVFNGPGYGGPDDTLFGLSPDPLAVGWGGVGYFSPTGYTSFVDSEVEVDYYRAVAGFRGDITSNWNYDLYGQYSRSDGTYRNQTPLNDALEVAQFRSESCAGTTISAGTPIARPCVDIDWYSPRVMYGDFTPEEYNFLFAWDEGNTRYTQKYVEGIVNGDLFTLPWSGPVGVALGATIREDSINDTPGYLQLNNLGFQLIGAGITAGKSVTTEAFGEISIPILEDVPFFQSLNFTGAARVTNVKATRTSDGFSDTTNGNWTYKLGLDWEVTDFLRLRGTYGTSYRAPALFEQFLADQVASLGSWRDPCGNLQANLATGDITQTRYDNCVADGIPITGFTGGGIQPSTITGGGVGVLEPETSTAWTASAVLTPDFAFLPNTNISIAVDYFDIEVKGEIAQLGAASIVYGCYDSAFGLDDPLCDQFDRVRDLQPGDIGYNSGNQNNVGVIRDSFLNINRQRNTGLDVTTRVVHDFAGDTTLTLQGQMTWQFKDEVALFEGTLEDFNGLSGEPKWVGDFNVQLDTGPWNLFYGLDVVGSTDNTEYYVERAGSICRNLANFDTPVCAQLRAPAKFYHSFAITREIGDSIEMTVGMSNLTNTRAPRLTELSGTGVNMLGQGVLASQYDLRGRRAFVNLNLKY